MCGRLDQEYPSDIDLEKLVPIRGAHLMKTAPKSGRTFQPMPLLIMPDRSKDPIIVMSRWGTDPVDLGYGKKSPPRFHARSETANQRWNGKARCAIPCMAWFEASWRFNVIRPEFPEPGWPVIWLEGLWLPNLQRDPFMGDDAADGSTFVMITKPPPRTHAMICDRAPKPLPYKGALAWLKGEDDHWVPEYHELHAEPEPHMGTWQTTFLTPEA